MTPDDDKDAAPDDGRAMMYLDIFFENSQAKNMFSIF